MSASLWMDPLFYCYALAFAAALFMMLYSIKRYLSLKNSDIFEEEQPAGDTLPGGDDEDVPAEQPELTLHEHASAAEVPQEAPAAVPESGEQPNRAETFVRGIYQGISGLDARLRAIEARLSPHAGRPGGDFAVKFLEDILQDYDSLDKAKIRARIEYLLSDLKK
jgi:hypothetical protein